MALWRDATAYLGPGQSDYDPYGDLSTLVRQIAPGIGSAAQAAMVPQVSRPNDALAAYMADPTARTDEDIQRRAQAGPPSGPQSLADLGNLVMPYLAGGAPGGTLSAGIKLPRSAAASDLAAPYLSKGADAPLFDYSLKPPGVPQTPLTRAPEPPKGIPDYIQRVRDPANLDRVQGVTEEGLKRLGDRYWYNPSPVLDAFGNALGSADQATSNLKIYADMMGNTTNLARVPQNMRMASWYYNKYLGGEPMPTEVPPKGSGYGHAAQAQHLKNVQDWWPTQTIDPAANPKPASFSENNMGNLWPYTWDTRNGAIWDLRNTKGDIITAPEKAHYGYLENTGQDLATRMGIPPARQQEASWVTMEPPGPVKTFAEGLEDTIRNTAAKFNMDPRTVRDLFAKGKQLLWGVPAGLLGNQLVPSDQGS